MPTSIQSIRHLKEIEKWKKRFLKKWKMVAKVKLSCVD